MSKQQKVQLVWFRRDLRVHDHRPLATAAHRGATLPLYIIDPTQFNAPDFATIHWHYIADCLQELRENLAHLGQPLIVRIGRTVPVLEQLSRYVDITHIWTHESTGTQRERALCANVRLWANQQAIAFTEFSQLEMPAEAEHSWDKQWANSLRSAVTPVPQLLKPVSIVPGRIPTAEQLRLQRSSATKKHIGGETEARRTLDSFLQHRGGLYSASTNDLANASDAASHMGIHLSQGAISERDIYQRLQQRLRQLRALKPIERKRLSGDWTRSLRLFENNLRLRTRSQQLFQAEPRIEYEHLVRAFDGLRSRQLDDQRYTAWRAGETGYPLVDASMRALQHTGWLTYSLRALLASFASNDLWLHWVQPAHYLARLFADYAPEIHYYQMQRYAGTTENRAWRIIDPVESAKTIDPNGEFIRRWVPELATVPTEHIHAPWRMDMWTRAQSGVVVGRDYPGPIVDHQQAVKRAKRALAQVASLPETKREIAMLRGRYRPVSPSASPNPSQNKNSNNPQLRLQL